MPDPLTIIGWVAAGLAAWLALSLAAAVAIFPIFPLRPRGQEDARRD